MRQVTGPFTAALGAVNQVRSPEQASGPGTFDRVIITNASPFLALVTAGTLQYWIHPASSQLIIVPWVPEISISYMQVPGGPANATGQAAYTTVEWLGPGEPAGSYPAGLGTVTVALAVNAQFPTFFVPVAPSGGSYPANELDTQRVIDMTSGTQVLVASPGAGRRIRIFFLKATSGGGASGSMGRLNDEDGIVYCIVDNPAGLDFDWFSGYPSGIPLNDNTSLNCTVSAGTCNFYATYVVEAF